jgi:phage baseplate assembly protein W
MAKLYNQRTVSTKTSIGSQGISTFTYRGFSSKAAKDNFKLNDIDLVKQDIINHFYIRRGEKLQNPEFGTVIWDLLFEQFTPDVKALIIKDVERIINFDPRIQVNLVTVDSTAQGIRIQVEITYIPFNITERMGFEFDRRNSVII